MRRSALLATLAAVVLAGATMGPRADAAAACRGGPGTASSRVGRLSKAGPTTLRWAAVEAAQQAWRPTNPWHRLYSDVKSRHGKSNPAKAAVARKVLIAAWHLLAREQPFTPRAIGATDPAPASSSTHLAA